MKEAGQANLRSTTFFLVNFISSNSFNHKVVVYSYELLSK